IIGQLVFSRDHGFDTIEVSEAAEQRWTRMVNNSAALSPFSDISYFFGTNIPGKPRSFLLNPKGRPKLLEIMAADVANDYAAIPMAKSAAPGAREQTSSTA